MNYAFLIIIGLVSGVVGGMGMGGGTLLIPLLTIFMDFSQKVAQGINLLAFLPMSLIAIIIHAKNNLIKKDKLLYVILPGILFSVVGALITSAINGHVLSKIFGVFLIFISIYEFFMFFKSFSKKN